MCKLKSKNTIELRVNISGKINKEIGKTKGDRTTVTTEYNLNNKYSKFMADIVGNDGAYLKIYTDGNLKVQTEQMNNKAKKEIEIDVSGVNILKFEVSGIVTSTAGTHSQVEIRDGQLWY